MKTIDFSTMTKEETIEYALETTKELFAARAELEYYRELFRRSQVKQFCGKSEQTKVHDGEQMGLFNEAEACCDASVPEPKPEKACPIRKSKEKGKKDKLLKSLKKAEPITYTLPEEEQICPVCGQTLHAMRKNIHREVEVIPAKVVVREHIQYVYSCRHCEQNAEKAYIVSAPMQKPLLKGSILSPSLGAYVILRKYENRDPLEKIAKDLKSYGVNIGKANLSNWVMMLSERYLNPLYQRMREHLLDYDIVQADETPLTVIQEKERSKCYIWMFRSGKGCAPIILYHYDAGSRAGSVAQDFLKGYCGYLQTDGYAGYHHVGEKVVSVGCLAHARRYYVEALQAVKTKEGPRVEKLKEGIAWCDHIFSLDAACHNLKTQQEQLLYRKEEMTAAFDAFFAWAKSELEQNPPKGLYRKALTYTIDHEDTLRNSLLDVRLEVSNNRAERAIKPFVMGRKCWLFCNTPRGAQASAVLYSIVVTAAENGLFIYEYLCYLLDQLRKIDLTDVSALDSLMPWSETLPDTCRLKETE